MDVVSFLSLLTLLSNIFVIVFLLAFIFKQFLNDTRVWDLFMTFLKGKLIIFAFIVAATATIGSLYFSEVLGYTPCKMCWIQRIFMYPLSIILLIAYKVVDDKVWRYVLPLSAIGGLFAAYHYYLQRVANPLIPCSTVGFSVSCSERFFMNHGYITIPWMALSAFVLITIAMVLLRVKKAK